MVTVFSIVPIVELAELEGIEPHETEPSPSDFKNRPSVTSYAFKSLESTVTCELDNVVPRQVPTISPADKLPVELILPATVNLSSGKESIPTEPGNTNISSPELLTSLPSVYL